MRFYRRMRRLALVALSGCSFAFVTGPPANHAQLPYFDCTSSRLAPALDAALSMLMALNIIALATTTDAEWAQRSNCTRGDSKCPSISRRGTMAIDGAVGIASAAGAVYGWGKTSECRRARAEQAVHAYVEPPDADGIGS